MELKLNRYFKASNVQFGSTAFSLMNLDKAERIIFTHMADTAYTITFEIFEIDGFEIKVVGFFSPILNGCIRS
jgi:hypothetical protein